MNLFSHLYFAEKPLDNAFYTTGLLYPDLNRNKKKGVFPNEKFQEGVDEHNRSATLLHGQDWFHEAQYRLAEQHGEFPFKRKSVLYHWGMEIAIDHFLLNERNQLNFIRRAEQQLLDQQVTEFLAEHDLHAAGLVRLIVKKGRLKSYRSLPGCLMALKRSYDMITERYPKLYVPAKGELMTVVFRSQNEIEPRMKEIKALYGKI